MRQRTGLSTEADLRAASAPYIKRIVSDDRYPRLSRWINEAHPPATDQQFVLGLECLLDGIASRILPGDAGH
jgi:hypothetical protein